MILIAASPLNHIGHSCSSCGSLRLVCNQRILDHVLSDSQIYQLLEAMFLYYAVWSWVFFELFHYQGTINTILLRLYITGFVLKTHSISSFVLWSPFPYPSIKISYSSFDRFFFLFVRILLTTLHLMLCSMPNVPLLKLANPLTAAFLFH